MRRDRRREQHEHDGAERLGRGGGRLEGEGGGDEDEAGAEGARLARRVHAREDVGKAQQPDRRDEAEAGAEQHEGGGGNLGRGGGGDGGAEAGHARSSGVRVRGAGRGPVRAMKRANASVARKPTSASVAATSR